MASFHTKFGVSACRSLVLGSGIVVGIVAMSGVASGKCGFCDEYVELNETLAKCYLSNFDKYIGRIEKSKKLFVQVNLGKCGGGRDKDRGGVQALPLPGTPKKSIKMNYLLDKARITCLKTLLEKHKGSMAPSVRFDIANGCS